MQVRDFLAVNWERSVTFSGASWQEIYWTENESGCFQCDERGNLLHFRPALNHPGNTCETKLWGNGFHYGLLKMDALVVPEGVTQIGEDDFGYRNPFFSQMEISGQLKLPSTLNVLGQHEFLHSTIGEIRLPASLRTLGAGALFGSNIHTLHITRPLHLASGSQADHEGCLNCRGRNLKDGHVQYLHTLRSFSYEEAMRECSIDHVIFTD